MWKVEPPSVGSLKRMIESTIDMFEKHLYTTTYKQLSPTTCSRLDALLHSHFDGEPQKAEESDYYAEGQDDTLTFRQLLSSPGKGSVNTMELEVKKLLAIQHLQIPTELFKQMPPKLIKKYSLRAATETVTELCAHPKHIRYPLLAILFWQRLAEVIDYLTDLLDEMTHKFGNRAKNKTHTEVIEELQRVQGKNKYIIHLLEATVENPNGVIQDIIKEMKRTKQEYKKKIYMKMHSSYRGHYRNVFFSILTNLTFRSNNPSHQPIIEAIQFICEHEKSGQRYFSVRDKVPIDGVIQTKWKDIIIEKDNNGIERINKMKYEIAVLQSLRIRLRCKEIWIEGANRYRNPDEDLPQDFEEQKTLYFETLKMPLDVEPFISQVIQTMKEKLNMLNQGLEDESNQKIKITKKNKKGWIRVTPLDKQPEPQSLVHIKNQIKDRWSDMNLLDLVKETDFHTGFTKQFKTTANREILDREIVQRRLLLSLFGLGTNTGLKAVSTGSYQDSYRELRYIRHKFIHKDHLRQANAIVTNYIISHRMQEVWGSATTACASDSKKFSTWDQNLLTEWHPRYKGRGIMIYWHTDRKSACIYSQVKSCLSSEVASMMEGVLRHCTDMEVDRNYVECNFRR